MIKQLILIVCASIAAAFFKNELTHGLQILIMGHNEVARWMAMIFSNDHAGRIIQGVVALIVIPVAVGVVLSFAYWIVKKSMLPHTLMVIWMVWTVLLTTLLAQAG